MNRILLSVGCIMLLSGLGFAAQKTVTQGTGQGQTLGTAGTLHPVGACCINGHYAGIKVDTACNPGHKPKKSNFTMDITQVGKCGDSFTARATDSEDGKITGFAGTVKPGGPKGCCLIDGKSTSGTDNIHFWGTMCKSGGKWTAKGEFASKNCKGTWEMTQM